MARALLLVDHGSRISEANALLAEVAARVQERLPDWPVRFAHMELAPPSIAEAIDALVAAGAREIVVHPYFLAPGNHSARDIPNLAREAAARHPGLTLRMTEPLGAHPRLVDVILDRVREAGG